MSAVLKKPPKKVAAAPRYGASHCLECDRKITDRSNYTFFCGKDCAADWGDDEAQFQWMKLRGKVKEVGPINPRLRRLLAWAKQKENAQP